MNAAREMKWKKRVQNSTDPSEKGEKKKVVTAEQSSRSNEDIVRWSEKNVRGVRRHLGISVAQSITSGIHHIPNRNVLPQTVTGNIAVELREGKRV